MKELTKREFNLFVRDLPVFTEVRDDGSTWLYHSKEDRLGLVVAKIIGGKFYVYG